MRHVDKEFVSDLNFEHYNLCSVVDDDAEMPLRWYESQPVIGKTIWCNYREV